MQAGVRLPVDFNGSTPYEIVGIQISPCGTKVWVCVNGVAVLRIRHIRQIELTDMRPGQ